MYPSLAALGNRSANNGLGGYNVSPVNVNAPGGVNAQRGYQNAPGTQPQTSVPQQPGLHPMLLQWLAQYARA